MGGITFCSDNNVYLFCREDRENVKRVSTVSGITEDTEQTRAGEGKGSTNGGSWKSNVQNGA